MTALVGTEDAVRRRLRVTGLVQGVGFRPFVHRLATELGLGGHVGNDSDGVFVEVEGPEPQVGRFAERLVADRPPLARIERVETATVAPLGTSGFRIAESRRAGPVNTLVAPDIAACDDCLAEVDDPSDRRFRYPFTNCTNCGPRFTITRRLPYDRANTTMGGFEMCRRCEAEYHEPTDRRFHAQPVACERCGPRLWFEGPAGTCQGTDAAIAAAHRMLAEGGIVAVKGLGGYHLACDATSPSAVRTLRRRKARGSKPLAVMVGSIQAVPELAVLGPLERDLLLGPERPIVLLSPAATSPVTPAVTGGSPQVGVLLAYTPLHHLLFSAVPGGSVPPPRVLVMTSGNLSDEPICFDDAEARQRLADIADGWLVHDRPIAVPCDDSVVRVVDGHELPLRRSRGYAPLPVRLPFDAPPLVATGGELKNTVCVASGRSAWLSQHIGDMGSLPTLAAFERSTAQLCEIYGIVPTGVAADAHPGYVARQWAETRSGAPVTLVQHHHAHVASLMAEHGVPSAEQVIGFAFDGTGYGTDGAIWGGEALVAGYGGFRRAAHLRYVPLPGGDTSIRRPYRVALAHLRAAGLGWDPDLPPVRALPDEERAMLVHQLERNFRCVPTSSMGRLFDAVSSLLGIRQRVAYEAQAAIELEARAAAHRGPVPRYRFDDRDGDLDPAPVLRALVADRRRGTSTGAMAAGFHAAVARLVGEVAGRLSSATGLRRVALSGGVFQNALLAEMTRAELERRRLEVLAHRLVPPNDGGLALGQAAVTGYRTRPGAGA